MDRSVARFRPLARSRSRCAQALEPPADKANLEPRLPPHSPEPPTSSAATPPTASPKKKWTKPSTRSPPHTPNESSASSGRDEQQHRPRRTGRADPGSPPRSRTPALHAARTPARDHTRRHAPRLLASPCLVTGGQGAAANGDCLRLWPERNDPTIPRTPTNWQLRAASSALTFTNNDPHQRIHKILSSLQLRLPTGQASRCPA